MVVKLTKANQHCQSKRTSYNIGANIVNDDIYSIKEMLKGYLLLPC